MIACDVLRDEVELVLQKHGLALPTVWLEGQMHDFPDKLRSMLQENIDALQDQSPEHILLAYCLCGNSTVGLVSPKAALVIPKFDDCIRMMLTLEKGVPPDMQTACYYLTRGWVDRARFVTDTRPEYVERYGEERTKQLYEILYGAYTDFVVLDNGAYDVADILPKAQEGAELLGLGIRHAQGSTRIVESLLTGNWDDEFVVVPPGEEVRAEHFR
jgi:hypothetical protein